MMNMDFYRIQLPDAAAPSFVDAAAWYYGTEKRIMDALSADTGLGSSLPGLVEKYFRGEPEPGESRGISLAPARFLSRIKLPPIKPFAHTHLNIWDCPYYICAKQADMELIYLQDSNAQFVRCVKILFDGLKCTADQERPYRPITVSRCWGFLGIMAEDETGRFGNRLLYADRTFKVEREYLDDVQKPADIDFSGFFDVVFGDG